MYKFGLKKVSVLITLTMIAIVSFVAISQATGPKQFDIGDAVLQIDKVEYFLSPAYNKSAPDIVQVEATLLNKAGDKVAFEPAGELYFVGESGKEYFVQEAGDSKKSTPFDLKQFLKGQHERMREYVNKGFAKEEHILPPGVYKWGFGTQIDRNDKIKALVYKNGDFTKTLLINDIAPVEHERPTTKPVEE